jgi:hypothetical protein
VCGRTIRDRLGASKETAIVLHNGRSYDSALVRHGNSWYLAGEIVSRNFLKSFPRAQHSYCK